MATLKDGATAIELLFRFNEDGPIDSVRAEAQGPSVDGFGYLNTVGRSLEQLRGV